MGFRKVGFFREKDVGDPSLPSIHDAVRSTPHPEAERIIDYLINGVRDEVLFCGCHVPDILAPDDSFCVVPGLVTDGVWLWPAGLAYYVRKYHVALPDEFIAHMKTNGWILPALSEAEKAQLVEKVFLCMLGKMPQDTSATVEAGRPVSEGK